MTYYGSKEMAASFRTVRDNTIKIAEEIPEDKYSYRPAEASRTISGTLTHIALSTGFQHYIHSNKIADMTQVPFRELMQQAFRLELERVALAVAAAVKPPDLSRRRGGREGV